MNLIVPFTECADSVHRDPLNEPAWALSEPPQALTDLHLRPEELGARHSAAEEESWRARHWIR